MTPKQRLQFAQLERRVMAVAGTIAMKFNALDEGICMCAYCVDHRALVTAMNVFGRAMVAAGLRDEPLGAANQPGEELTPDGDPKPPSDSPYGLGSKGFAGPRSKLPN